MSGGSQPEQATESFLADVVWEGKLYRMEVEGSMIKNQKFTKISTRKTNLD